MKSKSTDFEVLEFSNYTPTADDFDVEKQTGAKPIPPKEISIEKRPRRVDSQIATKPNDPQERWVYIIAIGSALLIIACVVAFQIAQMRARRTTTRQTTK